MKRFKKFGAIIFLSAYLFIGFGLAIPSRSLAADTQFTPQIGIPGSNFQQGVGTVVGTQGTNAITGETVVRSDLLARYIAAFYNWGFGIVGVIAVLMLMAAGVIWLTSGGDSGKISNAKKMIEGVLMGTGLLVGSWFLLNTINPNLTNLPAIEMTVINRVVLGCCEESSISIFTTAAKCEQDKGVFDENKILGSSGRCEAAICCIFQDNLCFNSTMETCTENGDFKQNQTACSAIATCKDNIITCENKKNGDSAYGLNDKMHCYNNMIFVGAGKEGESCGSKGDNGAGVCIKNSESCSDLNQLGGRTCVSGLQCCLTGTGGSW